MNRNAKKKMARRIATQKMIKSSQGTSLSSVLQLGSSQSRIAVEQIERIVEKGMSLIDSSSHKEHIYAEAGDMITNMRELLERLTEGLSIISYATSRIDQRKLKNKIPSYIREEINDAVKKDT